MIAAFLHALSVTPGLYFLFVRFAPLLDFRLLLSKYCFNVGLDGLQFLFAFLAVAVFGVSSVFGRSQVFNFVLDSLDGRNGFEPVFFEITHGRIIEHERRAVFFVKLSLLFLRQLLVLRVQILSGMSIQNLSL